MCCLQFCRGVDNQTKPLCSLYIRFIGRACAFIPFPSNKNGGSRVECCDIGAFICCIGISFLARCRFAVLFSQRSGSEFGISNFYINSNSRLTALIESRSLCMQTLASSAEFAEAERIRVALAEHLTAWRAALRHASTAETPLRAAVKAAVHSLRSAHTLDAVDSLASAIQLESGDEVSDCCSQAIATLEIVAQCGPATFAACGGVRLLTAFYSNSANFILCPRELQRALALHTNLHTTAVASNRALACASLRCVLDALVARCRSKNLGEEGAIASWRIEASGITRTA